MKERELLSEIEDCFGNLKMKPEQYSSLGLAYIGDAVFDLIIRTLVMDLGNGKVKQFHKITSGIVKAESQAEIIHVIFSDLTEEEEAVYRRGRNAKSSTSAKNASITDYRTATGFEAVLGYLYLKHDLGRALNLIKLGLEKTELLPEHL